MKIIFDTNVIVSALIAHGLSSRVLDICLGRHQLIISPWLRHEVVSRIKDNTGAPKAEIARVSIFLHNVFYEIVPQGDTPTICCDNDDNNVLHLAKNGFPDLIITGDKDLLYLMEYVNIKIINPRQYIELYNKK